MDQEKANPGNRRLNIDIGGLILFGKMRFSHTYAAHSCLKCGAHTHTSKGSPNWSWFYLLLAVSMALPLWVFSLFRPWSFPWYYGISILAGELLLFYLVGFTTGFLLMFRDIRPVRCPECRTPLLANGSYFKDAEKPNLNDIVLSVLCVGVNIGLWIFILAKR